MNTLDFARRFINFDKASLISGRFDDSRYPSLRRPLAANDNIDTKTLVAYKGAGCMGTVYLQILIAKHIRCDVGDLYFVAQDDEAAETWGENRGKGFILSIPDIWRMRKASMMERSCFTKSQWHFRHLDFIITGPSRSNRNSKQMRRVFTDEAHLTRQYEDGALAEFEDRVQNWDWAGSCVHATTAADSGAEVDRLFYKGPQNEYHWRCPGCDGLIWPLWREITPTQVHAQEYYGKDVFLWEEMATEEETLDTIRARCPHCDEIFQDTTQDRARLIGEDYVAMNKNPARGFDSYRWNVFAMPHIQWKRTLAVYRDAIKQAELGLYAQLENFAKKQLCASWTPTVLDFGKTQRGNYAGDEVWNVEGDKLRVCTFDFQEGHGAEGVHWWGQVDEWRKNGESRRIAFKRLESWADCRAFQLRHGVLDANTYCDAGHRDKEVFARCSEWRWFALIASDSTEFQHHVTVEGRRLLVPNPYFTQAQPQDSMSGQAATVARKRGIHVPKGRSLPKGWCLSRTWSKPNVGFLLMRLKDAKLQEYGIPRDIDDNFLHQLNSYVETVEKSKKTGTYQRILKQVKEADHSFSTSSMSLLGAIIRGFFPVNGILDDNLSRKIGDNDSALSTVPSLEENNIA